MKSLACLLIIGAACWLFLIPVDGWIFPKLITKHCNFTNVDGQNLKCCYRTDRDRWTCQHPTCPDPIDGNQTYFIWGAPRDKACFMYHEGLAHCVAQFAYQCSGGPEPGTPPPCQKACDKPG